MDQAGNEQQVGFRLAGEDVPVEKFIAVASKLTDLLKELETSVAGEQGVEWQIANLQVGSASLSMRPRLTSLTGRAKANAVIGAALEGLAAVEDAAHRPPYFTDQALRSAKSLVVVAKDESNALAVFGEAQGAHRQVAISKHLVAHVDELIGPKLVAIGALEGTLETLTIHGATTFSIYDSITGSRLVCNCDRKALDLAIRYFGQRVSVSGEVNYDSQGAATSIKVDAIQAFPTGPLPQAKDIRGLFSEHKVDIDEWARFVRDD